MPKSVKSDTQMQAFAADMLESTRQAKRGEGKVHRLALSAVTVARAKAGMSQS